jgi:hypothetical protein
MATPSRHTAHAGPAGGFAPGRARVRIAGNYGRHQGAAICILVWTGPDAMPARDRQHRQRRARVDRRGLAGSLHGKVAPWRTPVGECLATGCTQQIPEVARRTPEHADAVVRLVTCGTDTLTACGSDSKECTVEILDSKKEAHPASELAADHSELLVAVGAG